MTLGVCCQKDSDNNCVFSHRVRVRVIYSKCIHFPTKRSRRRGQQIDTHKHTIRPIQFDVGVFFLCWVRFVVWGAVLFSF